LFSPVTTLQGRDVPFLSPGSFFVPDADAPAPRESFLSWVHFRNSFVSFLYRQKKKAKPPRPQFRPQEETTRDPLHGRDLFAWRPRDPPPTNPNHPPPPKQDAHPQNTQTHTKTPPTLKNTPNPPPIHQNKKPPKQPLPTTPPNYPPNHTTHKHPPPQKTNPHPPSHPTTPTTQNPQTPTPPNPIPPPPPPPHPHPPPPVSEDLNALVPFLFPFSQPGMATGFFFLVVSAL